MARLRFWAKIYKFLTQLHEAPQLWTFLFFWFYLGRTEKSPRDYSSIHLTNTKKRKTTVVKSAFVMILNLRRPSAQPVLLVYIYWFSVLIQSGPLVSSICLEIGKISISKSYRIWMYGGDWLLSPSCLQHRLRISSLPALISMQSWLLRMSSDLGICIVHFLSFHNLRTEKKTHSGSP